MWRSSVGAGDINIVFRISITVNINYYITRHENSDDIIIVMIYI